MIPQTYNLYLNPSFVTRRIIWLGDLNYRVNLTNDNIHVLIAQRAWTTLLKEDQVSQEKDSFHHGH